MVRESKNKLLQPLVVVLDLASRQGQFLHQMDLHRRPHRVQFRLFGSLLSSFYTISSNLKSDRCVAKLSFWYFLQINSFKLGNVTLGKFVNLVKFDLIQRNHFVFFFRLFANFTSFGSCCTPLRLCLFLQFSRRLR